jgi:hypothetical protein
MRDLFVLIAAGLDKMQIDNVRSSLPNNLNEHNLMALHFRLINHIDYLGIYPIQGPSFRVRMNIAGVNWALHEEYNGSVLLRVTKS